MTPATQEQIEEACLTRSQTDAQRYLASIGLHATETQCKDTIGALLDEGRRGKLSTVSRGGVVGEEISAFDARMGCERMLVALARAFAAKADRLGISFEQAMATSLGNVAVRT